MANQLAKVEVIDIADDIEIVDIADDEEIADDESKNFDEDVIDEESVVSIDSDYMSYSSEDIADRVEKFISHADLLTLNERSKHCAIFFYYSMGGALALCAECMIDMQKHGTLQKE